MIYEGAYNKMNWLRWLPTTSIAVLLLVVALDHVRLGYQERRIGELTNEVDAINRILVARATK